MRRFAVVLGPALLPFAARAEAPPAGGYAWPNLTDFLTRLIAGVGPPIKVCKRVMTRRGEVDLWIQDQRLPHQA